MAEGQFIFFKVSICFGLLLPFFLAAWLLQAFGCDRSNMALNPAPFGRWTLRDKAAQRRLALR
ncbi:hypothetical protein GBK02_12300 [Dechloromonas sp. TW-R-39-2]|nr:hypothetical protein GBK02_12300 [Dechloromonas sp. TW-R-39-2]